MWKKRTRKHKRHACKYKRKAVKDEEKKRRGVMQSDIAIAISGLETTEKGLDESVASA
jgi:hypothetical protein